MKWGLSNTEFQYEEFFHSRFIFNSFLQCLGELTLGRNRDTRFHLTGSPVFPISSSVLKEQHIPWAPRIISLSNHPKMDL